MVNQAYIRGFNDLDTVCCFTTSIQLGLFVNISSIFLMSNCICITSLCSNEKHYSPWRVPSDRITAKLGSSFRKPKYLSNASVENTNTNPLGDLYDSHSPRCWRTKWRISKSTDGPWRIWIACPCDGRCSCNIDICVLERCAPLSPHLQWP